MQYVHLLECIHLLRPIDFDMRHVFRRERDVEEFEVVSVCHLYQIFCDPVLFQMICVCTEALVVNVGQAFYIVAVIAGTFLQQWERYLQLSVKQLFSYSVDGKAQTSSSA